MSTVLESLSEERKKQLIYHFRHFSLRLAERYNLLITFEYYVILCTVYVRERKIRRSENYRPCYEGYIDIHHVKVHVLKDIRGPLLTTLPIKKCNMRDVREIEVIYEDPLSPQACTQIKQTIDIEVKHEEVNP